MKIIMDGAQMKAVDAYSIDETGIPSLVLMERAAYAVTQAVLPRLDKNARVLCVCGSGNNGADGMAAARQLSEQGIFAAVYPCFEKGSGTPELKRQYAILEKMEIPVINQPQFSEYNCIIDAVFGIGLSREITGRYAETVSLINEAGKNGSLVVSVDIPSGVNSSDGQIMGCAVKADLTVTFGYLKRGLCLYPGRESAGEVQTAAVGFAKITGQRKKEIFENAAFTFEDADIDGFFNRPAQSNKGTYGKLLIAAGSENMAGAAALAAKAAYRTGSGLVTVFTHENNRSVVLNHVPEAVMVTYKNAAEAHEKLENELDRADGVIAGPGLSMSDTAAQIVADIAAYKPKPGKHPFVIFDADALNLIAKDKEFYLSVQNKEKYYLYTPHIVEMSRLSGNTPEQLKIKSCAAAGELADELHGICILKDAVTVAAAEGSGESKSVISGSACTISENKKITADFPLYINTSGNSGMATAGSGDTLTGILAGVLLTAKQKYSLFEKACMGVYLHGRAGDYAASQWGKAGMKAADIADAAASVLRRHE